MADATQTVLTVSIPTLAVLIGIFVNNARLSDLNSRAPNFEPILAAASMAWKSYSPKSYSA